MFSPGPGQGKFGIWLRGSRALRHLEYSCHPSEVLQLRLECIARHNGVPMLWHDQTKVGSYDQAIRIPEYTYQRLQERQRKTLATFERRGPSCPRSRPRVRVGLRPASRG